MSIRDARLDRHRDNEEYQRLTRKENQEWELAGLARQDGDDAAAQRHTENARYYARLAQEAL